MNNKRFLAATVLVGLAMLTQSANAAKGFKYSYAEFGYQDVSAVSGDGGGFNFGLSYDATDYVNVIVGYNRLFGIDDIEELSGIKGSTKVDVDRDEFRFGLGGHYSLTDSFDLTFTAVYVDQEFSGKWATPAIAPSTTNISTSEEGYEAVFGARYKLFDKLELTPHITHREIGANSNTGGGIGLVYKFYKKFSVRIENTFYSDDSENEIFAGVRLNL